MKKTHTFVVLMVLVGAALAWESWTIVNSEDGDTFSATISQLAKDQPFIPLMIAMACKHLFGKDLRAWAAFYVGLSAGEFWPLTDGQQIVKD